MLKYSEIIKAYRRIEKNLDKLYDEHYALDEKVTDFKHDMSVKQNKVNEKIEKLEKRIFRKFDILDRSVKLFNGYTQKLVKKEIEDKVDQKFDQKFDEKFKTFENTMEEKFEKMEKKNNERFEKIEKNQKENRAFLNNKIELLHREMDDKLDIILDAVTNR